MSPFFAPLARILIFTLPFVVSAHLVVADESGITFSAPSANFLPPRVANDAPRAFNTDSGVVQAGYQSVEPTRPTYYNQALQGPQGLGSPGPTFGASLPAQSISPQSSASQPPASQPPASQQAVPQSNAWSSPPSTPRYSAPPQSGVAAPPLSVAPATRFGTSNIGADAPRTTALDESHAHADDTDDHSAAEQSFSLEEAIKNDLERVARLKNILSNPQSEFRRAEASFKESESQLRAIEPAVRAAQADPTRAQAANDALAEAKSRHALARERYDLAIQTRKTLQEQLVMLEGKIQSQKSALDQVTGNAATASAPNGMTLLDGGGRISTVGTLQPSAPAQPSPPPVTTQAAVAPTIVTAAGKPPSKELLKAEAVVKKRKDELAAAEREAQGVTARLTALENDIELETKLADAARKKIELGRQSLQNATRALDKARADGAGPDQLAELQSQFADAEQLHTRAQFESGKRTERLAGLAIQRTELQRFEAAAQNTVAAKQAAVEAAEEIVTDMKSPFSPQNMLDWAIEHGPRVGVILLVMLGLRIFITIFSRRVVTLMVRRGARGSEQEREDRAKTLLGVFHNAVSVTIVIGGILMICEEVGIAAGPLMGGAAVFGLAVAFGAQNLIRDYFHGFVILLENQYKLNDILKIGDISGQVEQITLRMTVLRDQEGNVHFMPNGKIDSVTNMTHGWSRAVLEVVVNYDEDPDEVMSVLRDVAAELHDDRAFSELIVDEAEMLGIEKLSDASFTVKFQVKTRPAGKAKIKRELLRRIKRRFEEFDIGVPGRKKTGTRIGITDRVEHPTIAEQPLPPRKKAG